MNITLDEFTIMPNHFHGIVGIGRNEFNAIPGDVKLINDDNDIPHFRQYNNCLEQIDGWANDK